MSEPNESPRGYYGDLYVREKEDTTGGNLFVDGIIRAANYPPKENEGGREEHKITGDGESRKFKIRHGLGIKNICAVLYDEQGRFALTSFKCLSNMDVQIIFFYPPAEGETFKVVLRR